MMLYIDQNLLMSCNFYAVNIFIQTLNLIYETKKLIIVNLYTIFKKIHIAMTKSVFINCQNEYI